MARRAACRRTSPRGAGCGRLGSAALPACRIDPMKGARADGPFAVGPDRETPVMERLAEPVVTSDAPPRRSRGMVGSKSRANGRAPQAHCSRATSPDRDELGRRSSADDPGHGRAAHGGFRRWARAAPPGARVDARGCSGQLSRLATARARAGNARPSASGIRTPTTQVRPLIAPFSRPGVMVDFPRSPHGSRSRIGVSAMSLLSCHPSQV